MNNRKTICCVLAIAMTIVIDAESSTGLLQRFFKMPSSCALEKISNSDKQTRKTISCKKDESMGSVAVKNYTIAVSSLIFSPVRYLAHMCYMNVLPCTRADLVQVGLEAQQNLQEIRQEVASELLKDINGVSNKVEEIKIKLAQATADQKNDQVVISQKLEDLRSTAGNITITNEVIEQNLTYTQAELQKARAQQREFHRMVRSFITDENNKTFFTVSPMLRSKENKKNVEPFIINNPTYFDANNLD